MKELEIEKYGYTARYENDIIYVYKDDELIIYSNVSREINEEELEKYIDYASKERF